MTPARLRSSDQLLDAIAALEPSPSGLYLHLDLDVLDVAEAPVNVFSAPGGITAAEFEGLVEAVMASCPIQAVSLTAYDPECDPDDLVPPVAMRLLRSVASRC